jgi:hypothetical protein
MKQKSGVYVKKFDGPFESKELLEYLYYDKKMTQLEIANCFNVSRKVICNRFYKFNIKCRNKSWYGANKNPMAGKTHTDKTKQKIIRWLHPEEEPKELRELHIP